MDALARRSIDAAELLRLTGLTPEALASIDHRLPAERVMRLWELAADATGDPSFGVHAAEALPGGGYDVIDYILSTAATVGDALSRFVRYTRLVFDHSTWELEIEPRHVRLARHVIKPWRQYDEFTFTLVLSRLRMATGTLWAPERVELQHARHHDDGELARVFACPVSFGAHASAMYFAPELLSVAHLHADSRLLDILVRHADALLNAVSHGGDLMARVSATIAREMRRTLPTLASTAREVRLPARTLQRRLAEHGISHSSLVDGVRRDLAFKYLGDFRLGTSEIAYLLHFGDPAALHRAFKRWTGESPTQYRRRLVDAA